MPAPSESFHPGEREAVLGALRDKFALSSDEALRLAELAEATAQQAAPAENRRSGRRGRLITPS